MKVGLDFLWNDEINSGRVNYIYSLVNALQTLPDGKKPHLVVFHLPDSPIERLKKTGYPRLQFQVLVEGHLPRFGRGRRLLNRVARPILRRNLLPVLQKIPHGMVDCVLPCEHQDVFQNVGRRIHWIVDFNCYHLPHLFQGDSLRQNKQHIEQIVNLGEEIIFSSQDSLNDFRRFFPGANNKTHVLRFAVGLPEVEDIPKAMLVTRYALRESYFITPNTFWPHKNHQVLIRAMKRCVEENADFDLVLTGKQSTYHGDGYFQEIQGLVEQYGLNRRIHFLGLIDRAEQVALLRHATAIIQPSKFEGWSTVVEEAKALERPLIVSDIPIHREQVPVGRFFGPDDDVALAKEMIYASKGQGAAGLRGSYAVEVSAYGTAIQDCLQS